VTPLFGPQDRTATIALSKDEEAIVRASIFIAEDAREFELVRSILAKLRWSLEVSDILLGPVGEPP
jgi:hypothetical protein